MSDYIDELSPYIFQRKLVYSCSWDTSTGEVWPIYSGCRVSRYPLARCCLPKGSMIELRSTINYCTVHIHLNLPFQNSQEVHKYEKSEWSPPLPSIRMVAVEAIGLKTYHVLSSVATWSKKIRYKYLTELKNQMSVWRTLTWFWNKTAKWTHVVVKRQSVSLPKSSVDAKRRIRYEVHNLWIIALFCRT